MSTEDQELIRQAVADAGISTSEDELKSTFEDLAEAEGVPIKNNSPFSPFWRFVSSMFSKPFVVLFEYMIISILPNMFAKTATGYWLELIAKGVNLTRKEKQKTKGNILFTRIDTDGELEVEIDTIVKSAPINGIVYKLKSYETVSFADGESTVLVPCEAEQAGSDYNLADNYYTVLDVAVTGWTVTNESDWLIQIGTNDETDEELRARVHLQYLNGTNWHIDATYQAIIASFDGVSVDDIYIQHGAPRGEGSANAYLDFVAGTDPSALIAEINDYINAQGNHGLGDDMQVFPLPEVNHDLTFTVVAVDGLTAPQLSTLQTNIGLFIRSAFGESNAYTATKIKPNSSFSISNLEKELSTFFTDIFTIQADAQSLDSAFNTGRIGTLTVNVS